MMTSNSRSRVPATNDFSFLAHAKGARASHFRLRADFSRDLFHRTFGPDADANRVADRDLAVLLMEFRKQFAHTDNLIDKTRVNALNAIFQRIAQQFSTFADLLSEIQNEYVLVVNALINIIDEKAFLRAKINKLMMEHASRSALDAERKRIINLVAKWEVAKADMKRTNSLASDEEIKFILTVGKIYDLELTRKQADKRRKDLTYLGRWQFVKDWIDERAEFNATLGELMRTVKENNSYYRSLFPEDDNIAIHEYDTPEIRKVKHQIEEQRKITRTYTRDHTIANEKRQYLCSMIADVEDRIRDVNELLESKMGLLRRQRNDEMGCRHSMGSDQSLQQSESE